MEKSLEGKIEARIKQAEDRGIGYKAKVIANGLGVGGTSEFNGSERGEFTKYNYEGRNLIINYRFTYVVGPDGGGVGFSTEIKYKGDEVFKTGGGSISLYTPGGRSWERVLINLYEEAKPMLEEKQRKKEEERLRKIEAEERKEAKKWGL